MPAEPSPSLATRVVSPTPHFSRLHDRACVRKPYCGYGTHSRVKPIDEIRCMPRCGLVVTQFTQTATSPAHCRSASGPSTRKILTSSCPNHIERQSCHRCARLNDVTAGQLTTLSPIVASPTPHSAIRTNSTSVIPTSRNRDYVVGKVFGLERSGGVGIRVISELATTIISPTPQG